MIQGNNSRSGAGGFTHEIEEVIKNRLPGLLADQLHSIRETGNNAAHPMKTGATGNIVDVEPHEAEWTLDVLDGVDSTPSTSAPPKWRHVRLRLTPKMGRPERTVSFAFGLRAELANVPSKTVGDKRLGHSERGAHPVRCHSDRALA